MYRRMMMNKKNAFGLFFVALLVLASVILSTSCEQATKETIKPVSIEERMNAFIIDVNAGNYSSIKAHTHPSAGQYAQANADFWPTHFSADIPLSGLSISGTQATATGSAVTFNFTMLEDGANVWKIRTIVRIGIGIDNIPSTIFQ